MSVRRHKQRGPDRRHGPRRRTVLVDDWRNAWKWLSVQIAALIAGAQGLIVFVPTVKEWIPEPIWHGIMSILAIAVIFGRLKNQAPKVGK